MKKLASLIIKWYASPVSDINWQSFDYQNQAKPENTEISAFHREVPYKNSKNFKSIFKQYLE